MKDLVSIITPSYNSGKYIIEAINSVLNQSYQNWELLIIDDFSKDNSREIIINFSKQDSRIKYILLENNIGAAEARNIAFREAKGRFIAFLDSDDVWYPNKLECQLEFMNKNNYAFTFSSYDLMTGEGVRMSKVVNVPKEIDYNHYLRNTIIGCLTVMIDKDQVGYFEMPLIRSSHDMALWLLILKRGFKAYGVQKTLATYRLVSNSNTAKKSRAAYDVWRVYREIEKLSILKSVYCFVFYVYNALLKRI